ncbi:ComEC/Rec2-related protein [Hyella patelloides LEGE 07179]|uniref:ComEC/Rec2-related protein n=1 Tax=Hyella patelloides LEGE 07179 TaxID=945734 RepID=A0A563VSY0_9CYAN|nr:ComEC/Rec2 family competence protein [Hyella patelloides]VEP14550.1 ComEC/Rec2-related protein [Hyella patelloides LEGE 07179]
MNRYSWIIICLAYIIGLLATGLFYFSTNNFSGLVFLKTAIILALLIIIAKFYSKLKINNNVWLSAFFIAILATVYFNLRIPQPQQNDISHLVTSDKSQILTVTGKVLTEPRLNSNNKITFWLQAQEAKEKNSNNSQTLSGKLYITLPLLESNNIYPKTILAIEGALYKPKAPNNTTQFNFQKYLRDRGSFAGLTGFKTVEKSEPKWGWYLLRKRIIRAQVKGLGSPLGQLVSSMVLGRRAVDLPEDIRNLFIKNGLAHILAASGFHVSLLLGVILKLTNFLDEKKQLIVSVVTLLIYLGLTGFSPSVIRAVIMGFAVLVAMANKAKVRPLGSLLLAATFILLLNPLWIWDLGFQLSFLATLGLILTLPILEDKLDWLPSNLATAIAVPLAASIWVLPLISYTFNTIATYSIIVNLITTPLITIVSLGGMLTSAIALIVPSLGSYITWVLKYPVLLLIAITKFFTNLPSSTLAIGEISLLLLLIIYGLIILTIFNQKCQNNWYLILLIIIGITIIPLRYQQANLSQITILDTSNKPSIIIQNSGKVILINNTESKSIKYTILPFLASQGINKLDYLVMSLEPRQNYQQILSTLQSQIAIKKLFIYGSDLAKSNKNSDLGSAEALRDLILDKMEQKTTIPIELNSTITTNSLAINTVNNSNTLQLNINNDRWLITNKLSSLNTTQSEQQNILLWLGQELDYATLNNFEGKVAIAKKIEPPTNLNKSLQFYTTDRQGTISWTPHTGFITATEKAKRNNTLW